MTIAKYLRISDEDRDLRTTGKDESDSVGNQRNLLDAYISQHDEFTGAEIVEFCDDGWSGKNFERPGVRDMLEQVRQGKIQCIIVKDLSRFGRVYLTVGNYIGKVFPFMGVRFIAINDGIDSSRPGSVDSLDTSFKALLYDLYSRDLSRKIKSAKKVRAQRGDFLSPFAPYGYMKSPVNHNLLVPDLQAAETVRRIFHLAAEGHSTTEIARMMNGESVPTPMLHKRETGCSRTRWPSVSESNFWTKSMVTKILRDERYTGVNIYGKRVRDIVGNTHTVKVSREGWVTVANTHEAIVTREEFVRAQAAMRAFRECDGHVDCHPLARKVRCGICGHVLTRSGRKERNYYCMTHKLMENVECIEVHISEKELQSSILESLRIQATIAVDREKLLTERCRAVRQEAKSTQNQLAALHETQEQYARESRELYESFALGYVDKADYLAQKSVLMMKKDELAVQITKLQGKVDSKAEERDNAFIEKFKGFFEAGDVPDDMLRDLLKVVRVFPGGRMVIEWNYADAFMTKADIQL
jgi:DNA invertase Pin-like site-specific DNA recombinase